MNSAIRIEALIAPKVTFASHQNSVPVIAELKVINAQPVIVNDIQLEIFSDPPIFAPRTWSIDRIGPDGVAEIRDRNVGLNSSYLLGLAESVRGTATIVATQNGTELTRFDAPVEALARNEWGGGAMLELLAAFVLPNDPTVEEVLKSASKILSRAGKPDGLDGYRSGSAKRVWELASAIWSAVASQELTYSLPPASFEADGQKIRSPSAILAGGLATCLDTVCLFAAAAEQAGLNPILVLSKGHAFVGIHLQPQPFADIQVDEPAALRRREALKELVLFETTLVTQKPAPSFSVAVSAAKEQLHEEKDPDFIVALDVRRARMQRIRPLALTIDGTAHPSAHNAQPAATAESFEEAPVLGAFDRNVGPEKLVETPAARLRHWQRKLLDLTVKNRLLNAKPGTTALKLICPDAAALEDRLAEGRKITISPLPALDAAGRDANLHQSLTGERLAEAYAAEALERDEALCPLDARTLDTNLTEIYRKARLELQEGGANTLFLALGFLSWRREPEDERAFRAPLVLIPVTLERRTARSPIRMTRHEDEARFNLTLLELLRQDFGLHDLENLEGPLPTDQSGVDIPLIWSRVRRAVRDVPGFEVVEDTMLATFSFAKYLMWKDLIDRTDQMKANRVVRHLLETPRDPFPGGGEFIRADALDDEIDPADLFTPLPADSSQLAAIVASAKGGDFVLDGPPGTGKSQTIANMIAHNIAHGRRVLFVAEKMAALDVVYRRLEANGLGAFCLELHSNKASKADVVRQLGRAWETRERVNADDWAHDAAELKRLRQSLNSMVRRLHERHPNGMTVHHAMGVVVRYNGMVVPQLGWPSDRQHDSETLAAMREVTRRLGINAQAVADLDRDTFSWIGQPDWSTAWQSEIVNAASALGSAVARLRAARDTMANNLLLPPFCHGKLDALDELAAKVIDAFGIDLLAAFSPNFAGVSQAVEQGLAHASQYRAIQASLSTTYRLDDGHAVRIEDLRQQWQEANTKIWPLSAIAQSGVRKALAKSGGAHPSKDVGGDLEKLAAMRTELHSLEAIEPLARRIDGWAGLNSKSDEMHRALTAARSILAATARLAQSAEELIAIRGAIRAVCLDGNELLGEGMPIWQATSEYRRAYAEYSAAMTRFRVSLASSDPFDESADLDRIQRVCAKICDHRTSLNAWCAWRRACNAAMALDLGSIVAGVADGSIQPDSVTEAFEVAYARWFSDTRVDASSELRNFVAVEHEDRIRAFRALDDKLSKATSQAIKTRLCGKVPSRDESRLDLGYSALRRQLQMKRPSKPVRELIGEMGDTLTDLTPCLLMSPLSIAQYLPADGSSFDLVIFDEASQITPWDAIGAIARAGQVIVAGDPKQMPPTNFFTRGTGGTADDEDEEVEDRESVLEECLAAGLPQHRLTWHYRSRHESLIAFSNYRYYGGELVTFPAPVTQDSAVKLVSVAGVYSKGKLRTNPIEAGAIADEVVRRLLDPAHVDEEGNPLTIGVVTVNANQQKLIEDLLDKERRERPVELEPFFADTQSEPVVVKNLETVQGDERDVILLGWNFGPSEPGAPVMSMNLHPMNRDGGQRRLNVAITRARREMLVFASFPPSMIDLNRTKAEALRDLRDYVSYAERGPSALAEADRGSVGGYDSPFEHAVAEALRRKGWTVIPQIGVSRYRIDLGIVHPDRPGEYLVGVECDGATYHSAATARDRDKVRENILRGLGWRVSRVWSTDWWHDPGAALERLHTAISIQLDNDRAKVTIVKVSEEIPPELLDHDIGDEASNAGDGEWVASSETAFEPIKSRRGPDYRRAILDHLQHEMDAEQFYEPEHHDVLLRVISCILEQEAPILDDILVDRVARAYGFQRSGPHIRDTILGITRRHFHLADDPAGGRFAWTNREAKVNWSIYRLPADEEAARLIDALCSEELYALAMDAAGSDVPLEISRRLGVRRLTAGARQRIERAMKKPPSL